MWVNETRLWQPIENGFGWVLGFSAIDNRTEQRRAFEIWAVAGGYQLVQTLRPLL